MKAMKSLIIFSLLLAYGLTASADGNNNLVYNSEEVNGVMVGQTVYKMEGSSLVNYMKYSYTYDEQQRMTENLSQRWNSTRQAWENDICLRYTYEGKTTTTEYYKWNAKKKQFVLVPEMTVTMDNSVN